MSIPFIVLIITFFVIALLYASAGFGGGSSYLAVFAMSPFAFTDIRMMALSCNIMVVSGSVYWFYKHGLLDLNKVWPLVLVSIPFAFIGGLFDLSQELFYILLGFTLLIASFFMIGIDLGKTRTLSTVSNLGIGGGIGFLAGLVGIGGGIFLSPVLHLSKWAKPKVIAASTSFFILVNSVAGILGQWYSNGWGVDIKILAPLLFAVLIGGQIGSLYSIEKMQAIMVKRVAGILILFVSLRILYKYLIL